MMTRKEHIQYCKVCERRKFSKHDGIICGLTNEIADFEDDCINFLGDRSAIVFLAPSAKKVARREKPKNETPSKFKIWITSFFKKTAKYKLTSSLLAVCSLLFVVMIWNGANGLFLTSDELVLWGGNYKPFVMAGQYWRLITSNFVHAGVFHLIFNMYALAFIGIVLEPIIGRLKLLIAFLLTGLSGSLLSFVWYDDMVSVGSAGAIFGLYGVFVVLQFTGCLKKTLRMQTLVSILFFVSFSVLNGLSEGVVANADAVGGLIGGLILGFSLIPAIANPDQKAKAIDSHAFAVLGIVLLTVFVLNFYSSKTGTYGRLMLKFVDVEQQALSLYRLDENASNEEILKAINEDGIPNWELSKELVTKAGNTPNVLEENLKRVELLKLYCDYRIESYKLIARSVEQGNDRFDHKINEYNLAIERLVEKLQTGNLNNDVPMVEPMTDYVQSGLPEKALLSTNDYAGLILDYNRLMKEFQVYEKKALSLYQLKGLSSDEKVRKTIEQDGFPNWLKCKKIAKEASEISNISGQNRLRANLLMRYCDYRQETFRLIVKSIDDKTINVGWKIDEYNKAITSMAKELLQDELSDTLSKVETFVDEDHLKLQSKVLYVIDGHPVTDISQIKKEDVESVVFLKAQQASKIYGSRGKDGAMLVTTRK